MNFQLCMGQKNVQFACKSIAGESITIEIWKTKKKKYKHREAQKDAIYIVLFNGIPSSENCSGQKPLLNDKPAINKFKEIEKEFFAGSGPWIKFSLNGNYHEEIQSQENNRIHIISVNKNQLRKYLEQEKIIKPLNSIFYNEN